MDPSELWFVRNKQFFSYFVIRSCTHTRAMVSSGNKQNSTVDLSQLYAAHISSRIECSVKVLAILTGIESHPDCRQNSTIQSTIFPWLIIFMVSWVYDSLCVLCILTQHLFPAWANPQLWSMSTLTNTNCRDISWSMLRNHLADTDRPSRPAKYIIFTIHHPADFSCSLINIRRLQWQRVDRKTMEISFRPWKYT